MRISLIFLCISLFISWCTWKSVPESIWTLNESQDSTGSIQENTISWSVSNTGTTDVSSGVTLPTSAVYQWITDSYGYSLQESKYTGPTIQYIKNHDTKRIQYHDTNIDWEMQWMEYAKYHDEVTDIEKSWENIKLTKPAGTFEKQGDTIIYTNPTVTLVIWKDSITYQTATEAYTMSGGDWAHTTPTNTDSNR